MAGLSLTCADRGMVSPGEAAVGREQELGAGRTGPAGPVCPPKQRLQVPANKQISISSSVRVTERVEKVSFRATICLTASRDETDGMQEEITLTV